MTYNHVYLHLNYVTFRRTFESFTFVPTLARSILMITVSCKTMIQSTHHVIVEFFEENGINWWHIPPESPNANPFENLWHGLKVSTY